MRLKYYYIYANGVKLSVISLHEIYYNLMKKKQHCCKGHPAQQKHNSLVWSAGKSSDIDFPP